MLDAWPLYVVVLVAQALSLLGGLDDTRRVRRSMAPLNDLALRAEELGNASVIDPSKMESLEQAIERATVESPRVVTGDQDLASIEVALNRLLRQMQEAKLQQMRFVNDASHELRTPIAVIQGYVNMLDRWGKSDGDVLDESISALKVESEHMQELVEQLLFLARGDSGRNSLRKAPANLARIAVEVWEESAMIDAGHAYRLMFDEGLAHDGRFATTGDVALLKQAVRIVVQNAAKYSDAGTPISFDVGSDTHGIGDDRGGGGSVWVSVADEGVGMSPGAADHVFERFYRADNARERGRRDRAWASPSPSGSSTATAGPSNCSRARASAPGSRCASARGGLTAWRTPPATYDRFRRPAGKGRPRRGVRQPPRSASRSAYQPCVA